MSEKVPQLFQNGNFAKPVCLSMLNKVENLPPYGIPTQISHSDILKHIMVNCSDLSFSPDLSLMPKHTRTTTWVEPLCVFLRKTKLTSDKGDKLRFQVQKWFAHARFHDADSLYGQQYDTDTVDWEMAHTALLCQVPHMFRTWACMPIMDITPKNGNRPWGKDFDLYALAAPRQADLFVRYPTARSRSRKLTSQISALSDVKAIFVSSRYSTYLGTYNVVTQVGLAQQPEFGCPPTAICDIDDG